MASIIFIKEKGEKASTDDPVNWVVSSKIRMQWLLYYLP